MAPSDDDLNFRATNPLTGLRSSSGGGDDLASKFEKVLLLTPAKLPGAMGQELRAMLSPEAIGMLVGVLVLWAGSHSIGVGFVIDFVAGFLLALGVVMTGAELVRATGHFIDFINTTVNAKNPADFDRAAGFLAQFISAVGVGVFMALLTRRGRLKKGTAPKGRIGVITTLIAGADRAGMLTQHAELFLAVAKLKKKIIAVRWTNRLSLPWIKKKYPAKPKGIDAKTSRETGIVTVASHGPKRAEELKQAYDMGYYVVELVGQRLVAKNKAGATLMLPAKTEWKLAAGQIIDQKKMKPLVGDYDIMAVVDPKNPTPNLTIEEAITGNSTNPATREIRQLFNKLAKDDRVMHGAHDSYGSIESAGAGQIVFDGVTGEVRLLRTIDETKEYYRVVLKGRQTRKGSYERMAQDEFQRRWNRGEYRNSNVTLHPTFKFGSSPKQ